MDCCLLFCPSPAFIYILQQLDLPSVFTVANVTTNTNVREMYNNHNTRLPKYIGLDYVAGNRAKYAVSWR